ncbi:PREDICTED: uncharacterized protein LOC105146069 [Acromyrmex echinatior]|uniref:uncharacterized protein LOC105146069 n=1 Tax=Acromyrmex echinatior TaxID=103372 RepID=UPI000580E855|nr:PREDICTED: uncharacterized protein LOC105146069 [Acromyrmex echinatior]
METITHNGNYKWIDLLPHRNTTHESIELSGMRPIDVTPTIADKFLNTVYSSVKVAFPRFNVGDLLRMSKFKTIFEKGYTPNWTMEVFRIKVQKINSVTYLLENYPGKPVARGFSEYELHRVANPNIYLVEKVLRKKEDKVYVKWLEFNNSHNSWIHKDNVL